MATRFLARAILSTTKPLTSVLFRSSTAAAALPNTFPLFRLTAAPNFRRLAPAISTRGFATTQQTPLSEELPSGCDFKHWLVVMEKPEDNQSRDEIIDSYIKTLAMVLGSEEEARMKIYSVSTKHYFAFGALVPEELTPRIFECPRVTWVLPDSYLDIKNKDYGGEPFVNGRVVPYDPKYHDAVVRNKDRAKNKPKNKPKRENRYVVESQPSKTTIKDDDSALVSQPIGGAWMDEFKSCVDKLAEITKSEIEAGWPDYSISAAVKCLDEMEDFQETKEVYLDACEVLKDDGNRELFMSLAPEMRRSWLQRVLGSGLEGGVEFSWDADERERFVSLPPEQQRRWLLQRHPVRQP